MSLKEEIEMFQNALDALNKIPDDYQSRYYTDYKIELENIIYNLTPPLEF